MKFIVGSSVYRNATDAVGLVFNRNVCNVGILNWFKPSYR